MRINIAMAFDENYVKYAYVAILSILRNRADDDELHFYILQTGISAESRKKLSFLVLGQEQFIFFHDVDKNLFPGKLPVISGWPLEIYYRLLLPDLFGDSLDRILYLDTDIIANKSLSVLYRTDFAGSLICGCENFEIAGASATETVAASCREKGYPYICSGILLMDLAALRVNHYSLRRFTEAAEELSYRLQYPDQDLINYVLGEKIKVVDKYEYNLNAAQVYGEGIRMEQAGERTIIHFAGYKPWQGGHIHYDTEKLWWDYAKETPYYPGFLERFVRECVTDPFVYDSLNRISKEKNALRQELDRCREEVELRRQLNEKLLGIVNGEKQDGQD